MFEMELSLLDLRQGLFDLRVGGAFFVVDFDKLPAHDSLGIDDVGRRMRPAAAVGIEDAVAIDHFVVFVFEQRKVELAVEALAQHLAKFPGVFVGVDADGKDLYFFLLLLGQ